MKRETKLSGLYVITDSGLCKSDLTGKIEQALQGGATIVQYRDKSTDDERRLKEASELANLCHQYKALFIIGSSLYNI